MARPKRARRPWVPRLAALTLVVPLLVLTPIVATADSHPEVTSETLDGLPSAEGVGARDLVKTSVAAETPIAFSMVGFEIPEGAEVMFRTSEDGRSWTDWTDVPPFDEGDGPDEGSTEAEEANDWTRMSVPIWVGEAEWLQTTVFEGHPEDVTAHLIDSNGLSEAFPQRVGSTIRGFFESAAPPEAQASEGPSMISRSQWGADEGISGDPSYAADVTFGVVHHTAGSNSYSESDAAGILRGIHRFHAHPDHNGWKDIGYNVLIDRYGNVYEGRKGGLGAIGAHSAGFNTGSFGVAVMGNFEQERPPEAAMDALTEVLAWKSAAHDIDPESSVTIESGGSAKYPAGTVVSKPGIVGHRDVQATACPGAHLVAELPSLRSDVARSASQLDVDRYEVYRIAGDWNGDGTQTPGWYVHGRAYLRNPDGSTRSFSYGVSGDIPVVGDWNGNGQQTIGIIRDGRWHLRNANRAGSADLEFRYGRINDGDYPLAGDWNGDGRDTVGIVRDGEWHLRNRNSAGPGQIVYTYGRVRRGDIPVMGDWNGDSQDTPAIVRGREWHLRERHAAGAADHVFKYGSGGDEPVVGDWNGSGVTTPGIARALEWHLRNRNSAGGAHQVLDFPIER